MNVIKVKQLEGLSDFVHVAEDLELFATNSVDKSERLNLKKLIKYLKDTAEGELTSAKTKVAALEEEVKTLKAALTTFVTKVELYDEEGVVIKPIHLGLSDSDMLLSVPKPAVPASSEVSPASAPSSEASGSSSEMTPPPARAAEVNQ